MVWLQCIKGCPSTRQTGNRPGIWERNHPLAPAASRVHATGPTEYMTKRRFAGGKYDPVRLFATVTSAPQRTRAAPTPRPDRGLLSLQLWLGPHGILALNLAMRLTRTSEAATVGPINAHQRATPTPPPESRMPGPPKLWRKKEPPEPAEIASDLT